MRHRLIRTVLTTTLDSLLYSTVDREHLCACALKQSFKMDRMEAVIASLVEEEHARFPSGAPGKFAYGTAGFRER